jgi:hypothetical protein
MSLARHFLFAFVFAFAHCGALMRDALHCIMRTSDKITVA